MTRTPVVRSACASGPRARSSPSAAEVRASRVHGPWTMAVTSEPHTHTQNGFRVVGHHDLHLAVRAHVAAPAPHADEQVDAGVGPAVARGVVPVTDEQGRTGSRPDGV